jgi:hypothetical protein
VNPEDYERAGDELHVRFVERLGSSVLCCAARGCSICKRKLESDLAEARLQLAIAAALRRADAGLAEEA